jgi:hypothetical protein
MAAVERSRELIARSDAAQAVALRGVRLFLSVPAFVRTAADRVHLPLA